MRTKTINETVKAFCERRGITHPDIIAIMSEALRCHPDYDTWLEVKEANYFFYFDHDEISHVVSGSQYEYLLDEVMREKYKILRLEIERSKYNMDESYSYKLIPEIIDELVAIELELELKQVLTKYGAKLDIELCTDDEWASVYLRYKIGKNTFSCRLPQNN